MEFITEVTNPHLPQIEVPWFWGKGPPYEPQGLRYWLLYPHVQGFNLDQLINGDFGGRTWTEAASFIQQWAYFGMLTEVLNIGGNMRMTFHKSVEGVNMSQYRATRWFGGGTDDDFPTDHLNFSKSLPDWILLWHDCEMTRNDSSKMDRFTEIMAIVNRVAQFVKLIDTRERLGPTTTYEERPYDIKSYSAFAMAKSSDSCGHDHGSTYKAYDHGYYNEHPSFFRREPDCKNDPVGSPGHALLLSISVLSELLGRAAIAIYGKDIDMSWPVCLNVERRLHLSGWCPSLLKKLSMAGSPIRAYYLSSIYRGEASKHEYCCTLGCVANQINKATYETKHVARDCHCQMVSFDTQNPEYEAWVRAGHTGLVVQIKQASLGSNKWDLVRSHDKRDKPKIYVAISHVWSDGTGNAQGNSLPSCQLAKFQNAVNQLYDNHSESIPFWIDTISVPSAGNLKKLAIHQMEMVYRNADKVLVFDSGLQTCSTRSLPSECLSLIEISSWNERLWTIQEAAFAKTLHFQFEDGIRTVSDLQVSVREERFTKLGSMIKDTDEGDRLRAALLRQLSPVFTVDNVLGNEPNEIEIVGLKLDAVFYGTSEVFAGFLNILRLPAQDTVPNQLKWAWLQRVLPYRQTSIASDEGLCLATLLKMDLNVMYDLPDEERIKRVFEHVRKFDAGILFGNRPRLQQSGYTWMPSSFVGQAMDVVGRTATVTPAGLEVELPVLELKFPDFGHIYQELGVHWGFTKLHEPDSDSDSDNDDHRPRRLICPRFGLRDSATGKLYVVALQLPKGAAAITAIGEGDTSPIILLSKLLRDSLWVHGILVNTTGDWRTGKGRQRVAYAVSVIISESHKQSPRFFTAVAGGLESGEHEWLVT